MRTCWMCDDHDMTDTMSNSHATVIHTIKITIHNIQLTHTHTPTPCCCCWVLTKKQYYNCQYSGSVLIFTISTIMLTLQQHSAKFLGNIHLSIFRQILVIIIYSLFMSIKSSKIVSSVKDGAKVCIHISSINLPDIHGIGEFIVSNKLQNRKWRRKETRKNVEWDNVFTVITKICL